MKGFLVLCSMMLLGAPLLIHAEGPLYTPALSKDFVIRWSFQKLCNFVFDPRLCHGAYPTTEGAKTFDPLMVKPADIIFVRDVERFFKEVHPHIPSAYIMLTHGERLEAVKERTLFYLDDPKVIAWFTIHPCKTTHPKMIPIPLGILQKPWIYKRGPRLHNFFVDIRKNSSKEYLLYMNFADSKKPERQRLKLFFEDKDYCLKGERKSFMSYLKEMASCKFVLSPAGLAPDCYRNWEALLVGSIPVIKRSQLDPLFKDLPVLIVDNWEDVTKEFLEEKYKEITSKIYDSAPLYMDYWASKIKKVRRKYLARHASSAN